jgi:hypothetical protein
MSEVSKNSTKVEVCGKCVNVIPAKEGDKYPKVCVWVEVEDGEYKNTIPFEGKPDKFPNLPSINDVVRCSGFVKGRPSKDGARCWMNIYMVFMRVEGMARKEQPPQTREPEQPSPSDDAEIPF